MRDEFRDDLSLKAKLVDDLDALKGWASRHALMNDEDEVGNDEFADILDHLTEDIRFLI